MFDNMSGFWRMQCAEEDFRITPKNYSLYLDPEQRDKDLKISWVSYYKEYKEILLTDNFQNTYVSAKEKCLKWLFEQAEHFTN